MQMSLAEGHSEARKLRAVCRQEPRTVVGQQHESVAALHDVGVLGVEVRLPQVAPVDVPHHHPLLERVPCLPAPTAARPARYTAIDPASCDEETSPPLALPSEAAATPYTLQQGPLQSRSIAAGAAARNFRPFRMLLSHRRRCSSGVVPIVLTPTRSNNKIPASVHRLECQKPRTARRSSLALGAGALPRERRMPH